MKAKFIFDLDIPEELNQFERMNKSIAMACALFDIVQLRKRCYNELDDDNLGDASEGIDMMSEKIGEILEHYSINIDELI